MNGRSAALAIVLELSCGGALEKPETVVVENARGAPPALSASAPVTATSRAAHAQPPPTISSGRLGHCPNAVEGAHTIVTDVNGGVELLVVADTPDAVAAIRARARALVAASAQAASSKHDGNGGGHGALGRCPVVMRRTDVTAADEPGGARIQIVTRDSSEVAWLRREARERLADLDARR